MDLPIFRVRPAEIAGIVGRPCQRKPDLDVPVVRDKVNTLDQRRLFHLHPVGAVHLFRLIVGEPHAVCFLGGCIGEIEDKGNFVRAAQPRHAVNDGPVGAFHPGFSVDIPRICVSNDGTGKRLEQPDRHGTGLADDQIAFENKTAVHRRGFRFERINAGCRQQKTCKV